MFLFIVLVQHITHLNLLQWLMCTSTRRASVRSASIRAVQIHQRSQMRPDSFCSAWNDPFTLSVHRWAAAMESRNGLWCLLHNSIHLERFQTRPLMKIKTWKSVSYMYVFMFVKEIKTLCSIKNGVQIIWSNLYVIIEVWWHFYEISTFHGYSMKNRLVFSWTVRFHEPKHLWDSLNLLKILKLSWENEPHWF